MELHTLKPAEGSRKAKKRIGRGQGSGKGGTSTKGHNGAQSRSGYKSKPHFEGGQLPLQMRLPKFGFKCPNRIEFKPINLSIIQNLIDTKKVKEINREVLIENGLISKNEIYKILSKGELKSKIDITADAFSKKAKELIEAAGGKANLQSI